MQFLLRRDLIDADQATQPHQMKVITVQEEQVEIFESTTRLAVKEALSQLKVVKEL